MNNKRFNEDRLAKFAWYLKGGVLKCEKFYSTLEKNDDIQTKEDENLTPLVILPLLELPIIFKGQWYYDSHYLPVYKEDETKDTIESVIKFFGINRMICLHLFSPGNQHPALYGGVPLGRRPSIKLIGDNILELIDTLKFYEGVRSIDATIHLNN